MKIDIIDNEKLVWTEDISVNIEKFNKQHKRLFEIINDLGEKRAETDPEEYARLLSCLTDYFKTHFVEEEVYMEQTGYPDLKTHHAEHTRLIYDITMFNLNYTHEIPTMAKELQRCMKEKFLNHILNTDLKYKDFKTTKDNGNYKTNSSDLH